MIFILTLLLIVSCKNSGVVALKPIALIDESISLYFTNDSSSILLIIGKGDTLLLQDDFFSKEERVLKVEKDGLSGYIFGDDHFEIINPTGQ